MIVNPPGHGAYRPRQYGSTGLAIPLFDPGAPQVGQSPRFQQFLRERKDDAFLFVDMFALRHHGGQQQGTRLLEVAGGLRPFQIFVDLLVLLMKRFAMADLFQAMVQGFDEQFLLDVRVGLEQRFHQTGQRPGLRQGFQFWGGALDVIEQIVENDVFRQQSFGNFHVDRVKYDVSARESFNSNDLAIECLWSALDLPGEDE